MSEGLTPWQLIQRRATFGQRSQNIPVSLLRSLLLLDIRKYTLLHTAEDTNSDQAVGRRLRLVMLWKSHLTKNLSKSSTAQVKQSVEGFVETLQWI